MSRVIQISSAAGTAVSNTTTETSLASWAIPAATLKPGKIYRVTGAIRSTATNSTDTLAVGVRFGTSATMSSNTQVGVSAAVDQANDDVCVVALEIHVQSATRVVVTGYLSDADAEGSKLLASIYQILTITQTDAYRLDLTATWSVANAGNSCQSESFAVVEVV